MKCHFLLFSSLAGAGLLARPAAAQQVPRIDDFNRIGWYTYQGDHRLGERWTVLTEYQVRRVGFVTGWQQWLLRGGAAYQLLPRLKVGGAYTYLKTFPYGVHPEANAGAYPEQRFHEEVELSDELGRVAVRHRVRLEQRYVGVPGASGSLGNADVWGRQNRVRYQLALTVPLQGPTLEDHEWYVTAFDEIFINFGREVTVNVFNQNRISGGVGYRIHDNFQLELQYLNQITQHYDPDLRSGFPVFEFNNGFRLGVVYNLTLVE